MVIERFRMDCCDGPDVTVANMATLTVGQGTVVVASDDAVANAGGGAVAQLNTGCGRLACKDVVGAGAAVELGDGGVVSGDQQRLVTGIIVPAPTRVSGSQHLILATVAEPVMVSVGVQR